MSEESPLATIRKLRAQIQEMNEQRTTPQGVARIMSSYVNSFNDARTREFVDEMSREHRTLQQNFTRLCAAWLHHLGQDVHNLYDDRNEASVMLGRAFVENIPHETRHLPTI